VKGAPYGKAECNLVASQEPFKKGEETGRDLLRETLEEKVKEETGYERAKARQLKLLSNGLDLGTRGAVSVGREELHDRR
jgi:hypothetical protein